MKPKSDIKTLLEQVGTMPPAIMLAYNIDPILWDKCLSRIEFDADKSFKDWLEKRIAEISTEWSLLDRASPEAIAKSGKLTAYREVLDYLTKH